MHHFLHQWPQFEHSWPQEFWRLWAAGRGKALCGAGGVGQGEEGGRVAVGGGNGWWGVAEEVQVAVGGGVKWGGV